MALEVFLFEHKKTAYPPLPFKLGSYKFNRVKKEDEFVEELDKFHFGEIPFHRNDSHSKVAEHYKETTSISNTPTIGIEKNPSSAVRWI